MRKKSKSMGESKNIDHVCMPVLFVLVLLIIRVTKRKRKFIIYYDILPRYLRALISIFANVKPTESLRKFLNITTQP